MIADAVAAELAHDGGVSLAIAGGACDSDTLFHEGCLARGIPSQLYLALPEDRFLSASVQRGGPQWVERYPELCRQLEARVLQEQEALADWLVDKAGYMATQQPVDDVQRDCDRRAQSRADRALQRRTRAGGSGGTGHLVEIAQQWRFKSVVLDARPLLEG